MYKRLYRSPTDKIIGGVCGGLGEYLSVDPVFVRLLAVILLLFSHGFGFVAYVISWIIIPRRDPEVAVGYDRPMGEKPVSGWRLYLPGLILIAIGLLLLARDFWYWFDWDVFWPVFLIIAGLYLVLRRGKYQEQAGEELNSADIHNGPKTENGGSQV